MVNNCKRIWRHRAAQPLDQTVHKLDRAYSAALSHKADCISQYKSSSTSTPTGNRQQRQPLWQEIWGTWYIGHKGLDKINSGENVAVQFLVGPALPNDDTSQGWWHHNYGTASHTGNKRNDPLRLQQVPAETRSKFSSRHCHGSGLACEPTISPTANKEGANFFRWFPTWRTNPVWLDQMGELLALILSGQTMVTLRAWDLAGLWTFYLGMAVQCRAR